MRALGTAHRKYPLVHHLDRSEVTRFLARFRSRRPPPNFASLNIRSAWENDRIETTPLPVAIYPTSIHPRMSNQKSCFTIHRKSQPPLSTALDDSVLVRFDILDSGADDFLIDLRILGITHSTVFPDLAGLAVELETSLRPNRL